MMTVRGDVYYSRCVDKAGTIGRQDPVVYAKEKNYLPVNVARLDNYANDGYMKLDSFFDQRVIDNLVHEANRLRDIADAADTVPVFREAGTNRVRSIFQVHRLNPAFNRILGDPGLLEIARYILDDEVYIHQSRINFKAPFHGKEFYWHSDFETWHMEDGMPRMRALSVSIALTPNYECNGPLLVIPGSHKHYIRCKGVTPQDHFRQSLVKQGYGIPDEESLYALAKDRDIVSIQAGPGSVVFFDCNIMHGSNGNISPYPRVNLFFVYNAVSNRLAEPYCGLAPRPEFLAARKIDIDQTG